MRRSLTHVGGLVTRAGDKDASAALAHALDVSREDDAAPIHSFHTYPARMHPLTAARLVEAFAPPRASVLDPFCGSGTVLVEAMLAGRDAMGGDVNPLAVKLASMKTRRHDARELEALVAGAAAARAHADARREARAGATRRFAREDAELFEPHVLLELDGLRDGVTKLTEGATREELLLVLSAILVKVSRKQADTSRAVTPRRLAAGYTAKLFFRKAEELARALAAFTAALPSRLTEAPSARVAREDATELRSIASRSIACVVSSPPYAATYDYLEHHALRLRWLGLDVSRFESREIGARRRYARLDARAAREAWARELGAFFKAAARVLARGAPMVLLLADSAVRGGAVRANEIVEAVAPATGFELVARASQARQHFHGPTANAFRASPRAEHALLIISTS